MRRILVLTIVVLTVAACASSPPRPPRSEFEDIPVPKGLTLDRDRSTIIESPTVKAARLFYTGRVEPDSLGVAFRTTLESHGWRHLSSITSSKHGTTQVYEKAGNSLQVMIYESYSYPCLLYTCVELSATRVVGASPSR